LINGVIANNKSPYKELLSHGFVLDEQGRKMSKSVGNVIDPIDVCNKYGADILRLSFMISDYQDDIKFSENMIKQTSEIYRRIRNTLFKFILSNISDYQYIDNPQYSEIDLRILNELKENIKKINDSYAKYDFALIIKTINNHVIKLSS
jgi:isoleucyl-tRNA synthetase